MPRLITVQEWATVTFGDRKPHRATISRWISNGLIQPHPKKIGRAYFVEPTAEYVDPISRDVERMIGNGRSS